MAWVRPDGNLVDTSAETGGNPVTIEADNDFDWPYRDDNGPATVADWWERTDCRVMRIAVGQDNNYLDGAIAAVADTNEQDEIDDSMPAVEAETSIYCAHFAGTEDDGVERKDDGTTRSMGTLSEDARKRVYVVGQALLGLDSPGRPSFNEEATGTPGFSGAAQVGSTLTAVKNTVADGDGVEDSNIEYRWFYGTATDYSAPIHTGPTYEVKPEDAGKSIKIVAFFRDNERVPEMRTGAASVDIAGSPGEISRIDAGIRGVTVSAGDTVTLSVRVYGLQGKEDSSLSGASGISWAIKDGDAIDGSGPEITYEAPSSPGTYTVVASLDSSLCQPEAEADREDDCNASITVQVRRPSAPVADEVAPVNPPGEIQSLIPDEDGNQYEVFTPVEGGTFDGGEGYSISVPSGAVPNGEYIGIRMSDGGAVSNLGMTHQRYTLGGNSYGVHAVDASGAAISSYALEDPATVCVPLPAAMRANISKLSLAAINSDGSLTILAAQVRLGDNGTMVCGNLSNLPATVAVGAQGAPDAIPTPDADSRAGTTGDWWSLTGIRQPGMDPAPRHSRGSVWHVHRGWPQAEDGAD